MSDSKPHFYCIQVHINNAIYKQDHNDDQVRMDDLMSI